DGPRLRDDARDAARLGLGLDDRPARGVGGAARGVRRRRAALARTAPADADLPPADARRLERDAAARRRVAVLAVLPPDAVHAGGAPLLGAEDRRRVHRADA